jgi:pimeloyl-ACP methyl ester carboxylesterase
MHGAPFFDQIRVSINQRSLHVRVAGSGPPLLFLHGYPLDSRLWDRVVPLLAGSFMCIAPDLRGFGRNAEESSSFSMIDLADDCVELMDALQVRHPWTVCGLSMGGYIAMQLVERHGQRVAKVILSNTRCNADDEAGAAIRRTSAQTALRDGVVAAVSPMLEKLLCSSARSEQPEVVSLVQQMMFETRASTVAWAQLAMAGRDDFSTKMRSWKIPVLGIAGELDPITPPSVMHNIAELIPKGTLEVVPNSAHLTPLESPERFANLVRKFTSN